MLMYLPFLLGSILAMESKNGHFKCGQCHCYETKETMSANCTGKYLHHVPQDLPKTIVELNLKNNDIAYLSNSLQAYLSLEKLDLSNNQISVLDKDDFSNLHNLTVLIMYSNHIPLKNTSYPKGLFRHQQILSYLDLHQNSEGYGTEFEYPDQALSEISSLDHLWIDGLKNPMFGPGFQQLGKLQTLWLGGFCHVRRLRNDTFKFLPSIRYLMVRDCEVTHIEAEAFKPLINIHTVDLNLNMDLGISNLGRGVYGLQNSTAKVLRANKLHSRHGTGVLLRSEDLQYYGNTQLEEISFDGNRIELVETDAVLYFPPTLKRVSARDNLFMFGLYMLTTSQATALEWIDVSGQHKSSAQPFHVQIKQFAEENKDEMTGDNLERISCEIRPSVNNFVNTELMKQIKDPWPGNFTIRVPPNITFVNISGSKLQFAITRVAFGPNCLITLDMSYNFYTRWVGPILGLKQLEFIDLSHNFCDYIDETFVDHVPALKIINFSSNYLGYTLTNNTFNKLINLEYLNLSNNKIHKLPSGILRNLYALKHLDLSFNYMDTWDSNIEHMIHLTELDLSNNMFEELPANLESQLSKILHSKLSVHMENNPLKCTCKTLASLEWIQKNANDVINLKQLKCVMMNGAQQNMTNLKDLVYELEKSCTSYVGIMFGILSVVLLFLVLSIVGLIYRYRWKLRYLYYLTLNRHRGYLPGQDEEQNYEYDAFISYADEDRGFVVRDMRKILEEPEEPDEVFRLCIHHRDFLPGEAIAANIQKAINTSRKTVVILTRNFLKSYWCRYEVEMAKMESIYRGRNTLLIVVMEDIPVRDLSADIVEEMRKDSYVEFTIDREGQEVFWQNLKRAIRH